MTNPTAETPGTQQHQALLRHIVRYYQNDPRVLSVIVFGSLGRGDWDEFSDLDLDIIITDGSKVNIEEELRALGASFLPLGERPAIIYADEIDEGEIVLESLMMLSIRYHPLAVTSQNIVDSMRVLSGNLDHAEIAAAGNANRSGEPVPLPRLLNQLVRYAAVASVFYRRNRTWGTVETLHLMRGLLMQIFARTHGGTRPVHTFDGKAGPELHARMAETLPGSTQESLRKAFLAMLELLENDLTRISNGSLSLTPGQKIVIDRVRAALRGALRAAVA